MPGPEVILSPALFWTVLVGSAVLSGFGDILIFHWAKEPGWWRLAAGLGMWAVALVLAGLLFRHSAARFSVIVVLLVVIHLVIDVAWDVAVLGGALGAREWGGIGLAIAAVLLLQLGRGHDETPAPELLESEPAVTGLLPDPRE